MLEQINSLDEYLLKQATVCSSNEQALSSFFRAILEPVLESNNDLESDVVFKVTNRELFTGLLTRLEFSEIQYVDYGSEERGKEYLDGTDFLLVATSDFISFLSWKNIDGDLKYISLINSPKIEEIISMLDKNSDIDLSYLREKYNFSKFKNNLTTDCINKLAGMINNSQLTVSNEAESQNLSERLDYLSKKARYISHEIKNQLSICDLYSAILKKYCEKNDINDETISRSISCIDKAVKIISRNLLQLKSLNNKELKLHKTNDLIQTTTDLASVYLTSKNIELVLENNVKEEILVDETMFLSVMINLVKNASEAFDGNENYKKWIKISSLVKNDSVEIIVSNNAKPIANPENIFEEGITTKTTGNGLGLFICKKTIEELCGQICLLKSDKDSTDFQIKFCL